MIVRYLAVVSMFALWFGAATAKAEWFKKAHRASRRHIDWPHPFVVPDRIAARAPFGVMINNGWRTQNTLSDEHFDEETGVLNEAGELKVRDILTYSPVEHRTVYVLQARNPQLTDIRNRSVRRFAGRLATPSDGPQVSSTKVRPRGWSADYINTIGTRYNATTPDPRLPPAQNGGGLGGGGGSSMGGGGAGS